MPAIAAALDSKHPTITSATSLATGALDVSGNLTVSGSISGDIFSNFSAGTGITLTQNTPTVGITQITATNAGGGGGGGDPPISRVYSTYNNSNAAASTTSLTMYPQFNQPILATCPHVTYVAPNINTGGANTGFIIQTAGTYKITFTIGVWSETYANRVMWLTRLLKNGIGSNLNGYIFINTHGSDTQYQQYGTGSASSILTCNVNDYLQLQTVVAKNSPAPNNNFAGLRGNGGQMVIELIS